MIRPLFLLTIRYIDKISYVRMKNSRFRLVSSLIDIPTTVERSFECVTHLSTLELARPVLKNGPYSAVITNSGAT